MQSGILEITLNPGCVYGNSRDVTNLFLVSGIATLSVMCTALQYVEALLITPNRISYLSPALITFVIARFRRNLTLTTLAVKSQRSTFTAQHTIRCLKMIFAFLWK